MAVFLLFFCTPGPQLAIASSEATPAVLGGSQNGLQRKDGPAPVAADPRRRPGREQKSALT